VPAPERLSAMRIAAARSALDAARWPKDAIVLRVAPDEVLVIAAEAMRVTSNDIADPHAIVEPETGFAGAWISSAETARLLERHCAWEWRQHAGGLAQGAIAGLPIKIWFEADRALWLVPEAFAADFERLS
jgi:hypothetical protein